MSLIPVLRRNSACSVSHTGTPGELGQLFHEVHFESAFRLERLDEASQQFLIESLPRAGLLRTKIFRAQARCGSPASGTVRSGGRWPGACEGWSNPDPEQGDPGLCLGSLAKIPSHLAPNWSCKTPLVCKSGDLEASKEANSPSSKHRSIQPVIAILLSGRAQRHVGPNICYKLNSLGAMPLKLRELGERKWGAGLPACYAEKDWGLPRVGSGISRIHGVEDCKPLR